MCAGLLDDCADFTPTDSGHVASHVTLIDAGVVIRERFVVVASSCPDFHFSKSQAEMLTKTSGARDFRKESDYMTYQFLGT